MNKQEKIEFVENSQQYVEMNKVQDIFKQLLKELVFVQPADPMQHLIDFLGKTNKKKLIYFLIGANQDQNSQIGDNISLNFNYKHIDFKKLSYNELGEQKYLEHYRNHLYTIDDKLANELFQTQYDSLSDSLKGLIITGYPQTLAQMNYVQKMGIIQDRLFIVKNNQIEQFQQICKQIDSKVNPSTAKVVYEQNIREIKLANKGKYFTELEGENIGQQIENILSIQNKKKVPLRPPRVLIVRKNEKLLSKRIVKDLSYQLDLVGVVSIDCIQKEINEKTDLGKQLHHHQKNIPDDVITYLITSHLKSIKAKNYGWACEGFPRNIQQLNKFKNDKTNPDLIVIINEQNEDSEYKQLKELIQKLYDQKKILSVSVTDKITENILEKLQNNEIYS